MQPNFQKSKLHWLELVVKERFGHKFSVVVDSNSLLSMHLQNDERKITFRVEQNVLTSFNSNLPCSFWNAALEGWNSVIGFHFSAWGGLLAVSSHKTDI